MLHFVYALLSALVVTAIARGLTIGLKLDHWVAGHVVRAVDFAQSEPRIASAVSWIISGIAGAVALVSWLALHVDERIYDWWSPEPPIASLRYVDEIETHFQGEPDGIPRNHVEITLRFTNDGNDTIKVHGIAYGAINGFGLRRESASPIDSYVRPHRDMSAIVILDGVPIYRDQPVRGIAIYDFSYIIAERGVRACHTSKAIFFGTLGEPKKTDDIRNSALYRDQHESCD